MSKTQKHCSICHAIPVSQPHDVLKGYYLCAACEAQKSYWLSNEVTKGRMCKLPSFSLEFEIAAEAPQRRRALILLQYQFERTHDSSVDDEYKSPIYANLRAFRKPLMVLHELRDLVSTQCGTHLHVAFEPKGELYSVRETVFGPLIAYLSSREEQTIAFWGRTFCDQAQASLDTSERHVCFNVRSRHPTIEYRLPRFRTAEQYLAVVRFCRSITAFLEGHLDPYNSCIAPQARSKPLAPEQIGNQVLLRYKKAWKTFEATAGLQPLLSAQLPEERTSHV
ncbi:MAG TPA: hypothetical protein VH593_28895 [Ktedonobacteraceae bacterium]